MKTSTFITVAELIAKESPFVVVPEGDSQVYVGVGLANAVQLSVVESPAATTTVV